MAENFITFPTADLDMDNLPTTLTNAILSTTTSISGLTNATAYRTFVLSNPSGSFTPVAAATGITEIATRTAINDTSLSVDSYTGSTLSSSSGTNRVAILCVISGTRATLPTSISATWGAQAFTVAGSSIPASTSRAIAWVGYIKDADIPASGAITVTPDNAGMSGCLAYLVEYSGVNQTTPFGTPGIRANSSGSTEFPTVTMTATDSMFFANTVNATTSAFPGTVSQVGAVVLATGQATSRPPGLISSEFPGATGQYFHTITWSASGANSSVAVEVFPA